MHTMTEIVGGVDTHTDMHVAAVLTTQGAVLEVASFPTTQVGHANMLAWFGSFGDPVAVGVEGTGSYGKGLTNYLTDHDVAVIEVGRVNRQSRRRHGKTDTKDAVAAARAVLSGEATAVPRDTAGPVESLRVLRIARNSAVKNRAAVTNRIKSIIVTAPEPIRAQLRDLTTVRIVAIAGRYRPDSQQLTCPTHATKHALRSLANQYQALTQEIEDVTNALDTLVTEVAPVELTEKTGVGTVIAADMMITYGSNPDRIHSRESFGALCGVSPVDASSGRQQRHRLNRGGDRQANAALYRIVLTRLRRDPATIEYMNRRTSEGKTRKETIRCLKYYVAREIHDTLKNTT